MATCAVCQSPIVEPQKFVIDGTEVLHRACALSGQLTVLQRTQQALANAQHAESNAHRHLIEYRSKISILEGKVREHETDLERVQRDLRVSQRHHAKTRAERDAAIAERDAARREAALHQHLAASTTPDSEGMKEEVAPKPEGDPSETRFSLLEFD